MTATAKGCALQLCALRYLGFVPRNLLDIPSQVVKYVADQLKVSSDDVRGYEERNQRGHQKTIQAHLGFRRVTDLDLLSLEKWLLERALEHDKPTLLFQMACAHLKQHQIVRIGTTRLEQIVSKARYQAQEVTYESLQLFLSQALCTFLDGLLEVDQTLKRTRLSWLQKTPRDHNLGQMLETLDKITFLKQQGVVDWDLSAINPIAPRSSCR